MAQTVKNQPAMQETWVRPLVLGRSLREGNGNPLQYFCLENSMDRGAWRATVQGAAKSQIRLTNTFFFSQLTKMEKVGFQKSFEESRKEVQARVGGGVKSSS